MLTVLRTAEKAAASSIAVLIEGESGVGKELIARAIHGSGERRAKPFVTVNCGAIPENLVESALFGHEKGAFTGAAERHAGKFVDASGGTLFLDEIGELPLAAQVKLLRVLQEGEVGAKKPVKVDVRIISATNRDLIADVRTGRFREDLYYRLSVFPVGVPPLRERTEDIPHLVRHFLLRFAAEEGKRVRTVSAEALALLMGFSWPGNVRQLENAIFRSVVLAEGDTIGIEEFPQIAVLGASETTLVPDQGIHAPSLGGASPMQPLSLQPDDGAAAPAGPVMNLPLSAMLPLLDATGDVLALEAIEAAAIRFAIAHYRGQMSEVARKLRIGRSTLYRKIEHLGLAEGPGEADVSGR
jgi:DNA-binding NtrC family response regulator